VSAAFTTIHGMAEDGAIVSIEVAVSNGTLESKVRDYILDEWWPPIGLQAIDQPDSAADLEMSVDPTEATSLIRMESDLSLWAASHLSDLVAVHAAVFADGDSVVALPGPSFAGKSTLSLAAMKLGLDVEFTSQGETVVALLANTVCAQSRPSDAFGAAVAEARLVNGVRGTRGEAVLAIAEIRRMLSDRPAVELD
jgi:hypothetical protein